MMIWTQKTSLSLYHLKHLLEKSKIFAISESIERYTRCTKIFQNFIFAVQTIIKETLHMCIGICYM